MAVRKFIISFYLKIYFQVLLGLIAGSHFFGGPVVIVLATSIFCLQIVKIFSLNSRILPSFNIHFALCVCRVLYLSFFKLNTSNFVRVPVDVPLCLLCFGCMALQFVFYRLQMHIGPRLKTLKLENSPDSYCYFGDKTMHLVPTENADCPVCFSPLAEIIDFEEEMPKNESSSLIMDYIGGCLYMLVWFIDRLWVRWYIF